MSSPYFGPDEGLTIYHGNCLDVLPTLDAVDAVVTDPPYGLSFMSKEWDHGVPGEPFWKAVLGAMKPGAHLLAFGGTRTHHRLMVGIEDAGFEIRDVMMWVYGSGFPKNHDISKALDQEAGAEREVIGVTKSGCFNPTDTDRYTVGGSASVEVPVTAPATEAAKKWDGWGTALKPAWEPIIIARKPLAGNLAQNINAHGVGGLNIDSSRIPLAEGESTEVKPHIPREGYSRYRPGEHGGGDPVIGTMTDDWKKGRWPANLVHDGSEEVVKNFPDVEGVVGSTFYASGTNAVCGTFGSGGGEPGVPDFGSAARFYYCAKASKADRDEGLEGEREWTAAERLGIEVEGEKKTGDGSGAVFAAGKNHHPTVKPVALMRYLVRLVTPPGGVVLDPFMGSGSTGKAADLEGCRFIGIDIDESFCELASKRRQRQRVLGFG